MSTLRKISVLLLDDDLSLSEELNIYLTHAGFQVTCVASGPAAIDFYLESTSDIAIIDLNLPGQTGLSVSRELRNKYPSLGLIVLTARTSPVDRINAYESGADFYLAKPISGLELTHVIRSLHKRIFPNTRENVWQFYSTQNSIKPPGTDTVVKLTSNEAELLRRFATSPNLTLTVEEISAIINPQVDINNIEKHNIEALISRMRKKLSPWLSETDSRLVQSVRNYGYQLSIDIERQ